MKFSTLLFAVITVYGCKQQVDPPIKVLPVVRSSSKTEKTYEQVKQSITDKKMQFITAVNGNNHLTDSLQEIIKEFWVKTISEDMFNKWAKTPWDYNGTATSPQEGPIACGFFVTTILRDMGVKLNRTKLAVCASSEMMKALCPGQIMKNLSYLQYNHFADSVQKAGIAVYIIGLDFHTGFIVNDGHQVWFIHSNYIKRQGVVKEKIMNSVALRSSKTRWMVSLTADKSFLFNWLNN